MATHSNTRAWRIPRTEEPGYRPWDHKELDTTVQLTLSQTLQLIRGQKIEGIKEQHRGSREKEVGRGV